MARLGPFAQADHVDGPSGRRPHRAWTEKDWLHKPFSGDIADGYVWGRGSWDHKSNLLAVLEALEMLIASGATPKRTVILASGHDEEIG